MIKILIKFWPIFIPIAIYIVWFLFFRKKKEASEKISELESRLWIMALSASLVIALVTIIILIFSTEGNKGSAYKPAEYKDGHLIPGEIIAPDE